MVAAVTDANFAEKQRRTCPHTFWAAWWSQRMQGQIDFGKLAEEVHEDELKIFKWLWTLIQIHQVNLESCQSRPLIFKRWQVVKQVVGVHTKEQLKAIVAELS